MPEIYLQNLVTSLLEIVRKESDTYDENETMLYKLFHHQVEEEQDPLRKVNESLYPAAKEIFLANKGEPNFIETRLFFDRNRIALPTVHINLPSQVPGPKNSIGMGLGDDLGRIYDKNNAYATDFLYRNFDSTFNLICTAQNPLKTMLIFNVLQTLLSAVAQHLEMLGLENLKIGGVDLQVNDETQSVPIYVRAITLSFIFDKKVPTFVKKRIIKDIIIEKPNVILK